MEAVKNEVLDQGTHWYHPHLHGSTALQTGGDEGMWSYDRYGRWMEGKPDWITPAETAGRESPADPEAVGADVVDADSPRPARQSRRSPGDPDGAGTDRIVIDEADTDLDTIASQLTDEYGGTGDKPR